MRRSSSRNGFAALGFVATAFVLLSAMACGTEPVGVDSCRRIEHARCENAPACGINLERPVHNGDSPERNVAACNRFYDDACLHGLAVSADPGAVAVDACIEAIHTGNCDVVKKPESHPSCSFLAPPPPPPAPAPAPAVDAATDG